MTRPRADWKPLPTDPTDRRGWAAHVIQKRFHVRHVVIAERPLRHLIIWQAMNHRRGRADSERTTVVRIGYKWPVDDGCSVWLGEAWNLVDAVQDALTRAGQSLEPEP